ncbi:hypothetical protein H0H81_003219 [Sphagnurus paluster]|uniref:Protein CASP n=1 Tax=Sphagnurus paluster TaxID=117069 RepID=A0A9P7GS45_9AGAR|nr:hypothetical protein H0H81_003219 [Sphagnurus paluster]
MSSVEQNFSGALSTWREFKKLPEIEKPNAFKGLLKAYQTEIDNLTKRSKSSENAFLNVYKVLAEAPDPYPLLEAAVDQTVKVAEALEAEAELRRLRDENIELRKRVSDFSSLENAKKKSDTRVEQLEQKMEEMIHDKVLQKENELNATYDEKLRNYEEREQDLQRQISLTKNQLRDLRMSNDSNQAKLMDHSQRQDQEVVAKLAEVDMIVADLDRANSRVATVERRNVFISGLFVSLSADTKLQEMLRAEIESMRSGNDTSDRYVTHGLTNSTLRGHANSVKSLEAQIAELEGESERMSRALDAQKDLTSELEAAATKKIDELSKEIQKKAAEVEQLKQKMKQYNDYDEIKRELEIMKLMIPKYVEFAGLDEDMEDELGETNALELHLPNPNAEKANAQQGNSLEALLATKNKRILEELTKFRILHSELEESLQVAQEQLKNLGAELEKQKTLNEKLENDLLSMNKHQHNGNMTPSESGVDILAGLELGTKKSSDPSRAIPFTSSADTSILPIVTSQRDRFRQRNAELEDELRKQFQIISELRTEIKSLQSDNLKLYEKVRYMQSYRDESGSRAPTSQLNPLPAPSGRLDDISKYQVRYEEAMNPFEAFRGREATRAYGNLNPVERGVLTLTRSILGNRRARTFFIIYALLLHILVLYSSYECAGTSHAQVQKQPRPF